MNPDRLGAVDATYLAIESERTPLHVCSLGLFDGVGLVDEHGALRLDDLRRRIDARLGLLPRLRQRVLDVPFGIARPVWVDDERFDIANHVDVVALRAPGDEATLVRLVEQVQMTPLPRDRPLWHLRFVTGLEDGRVALVERAHHAMVDGVSGVDVSAVLLDLDPDAPDPLADPWSPRPTPTPSVLLAEGIADRLEAPLAAAWRALGALQRPADVLRGAGDVVAALRAVGREKVRAPASSINRQVGRTRHLALIRQRFDEVHAAGEPVGATVNDVVLAAVAGGLRDLFLGRGETLGPTRSLKVLIPVSVRASSESLALGNRVGALLANLPIGIGDPHERLIAIAAMTRELKASSEATTTDLVLQVADLLPQSIASAIQHGVHHQPLVNLVVTNVPGPPFPLYAMGSRLLEAFPVVPLGGNMTVEVAVLSYDGALNLCVTADRETCPDVDVFAEGIARSFSSLGVGWVPAAFPR